MAKKKRVETKEGHIQDYITNKWVKATPEEIEAVQVFAKSLVEDYGYKKTQIQTHSQWRVKARPSDKKKEYPVDIAVFKSERKIDDNLWIIVECKKKTRKDGESQLKDYLRLSEAQLGVWFNGKERLFLKKTEKEGKVYFEEIPIIPRAGQRIADIGLFKRKDLKPPRNLKSTFNAMRNYLAGMAVGATRDEVLAQQLINVIFCKIYDEKFTKQDNIVQFRAGIKESTGEVKERILHLFKKVKKRYPEIIDVGDSLNLDARSLTYIVGELQNFCLTDAERDVIAEAFEVFIGPALKGSQGQFFTPRNVIQTLVRLVDPSPKHLIIDPACGSGGFLIDSLRYVWNKIENQGKRYEWKKTNIELEKLTVANSNFKGVDKDYFLSKVTKAYMAIVGDGKGGIFCEDSLDSPKNWDMQARDKIQLGSFDIVLTNPPFGSKIKVEGEEKLKQYDLAYRWKKSGTGYAKTAQLKDSEEPQILFIERCLQLLKDGGILGIVLPETYFHAPKTRYILQFLKKHNIKAIIDLAHNTFRPHCNAKTMLLVLQKNKPQEEKIIMAVAEEVGHDHNGKPIYRFDQKTKGFTEELWDDTEIIREEINNPDKKGNKNLFAINTSAIKTDIYIPRYYWGQREKELKKIAKEGSFEMVGLSKLIRHKVVEYSDGHGSPPGHYKGRGEVPYIRVKDIVNWEIYKNPTSLIPRKMYLKIKGSGVSLKEKDIIFVRRGSYRIGTVAMVSPDENEILLTRELLVIRVINDKNQWDINPYYLIYLLSHELAQKQLRNKIFIETTLPNIGNRWKEIYLPVSKSRKKRKYISERIRQAFGKKWGAQQAIKKLRSEFGDITT